MNCSFTIAAIVWLKLLRRKDVYVLLILLGVLLFSLVSLNVFGLGGAVRYAADIGLLLAWLFSLILAVTAGARELPNEEQQRTVYVVLAKPVKRSEVVLGKWLGTWSVVTVATFVFYLLIVALVSMRGEFRLDWTLVQALALHACALAVVSGIAVLFSTRLNADAAATLSFVVTGAAMLIVPQVPELAARSQGFRATGLLLLYNLLPHFELFDLRQRLVHGYGPVHWNVFALVVAYGTILTSFFLILAWLGYRHKRFSRSAT